MKKRMKSLLISVLQISTIFLLSDCTVENKNKDVQSTEASAETSDQAKLEVETYETKGVVRSIPPNREMVFIAHDDIEGFMHAMVMPFKVQDSTLLSGIHPKDSVRIKLEFDGSVTTLKEIEKILSN